MKSSPQAISSTLLLFGINSCKIVPSGERQLSKALVEIIEKDRVGRSNLALSLVEKASGDVYETKYILCDRYCAARPKRAATSRDNQRTSEYNTASYSS